MSINAEYQKFAEDCATCSSDNEFCNSTLISEKLSNLLNKSSKEFTKQLRSEKCKNNVVLSEEINSYAEFVSTSDDCDENVINDNINDVVQIIKQLNDDMKKSCVKNNGEDMNVHHNVDQNLCVDDNSNIQDMGIVNNVAICDMNNDIIHCANNTHDMNNNVIRNVDGNTDNNIMCSKCDTELYAKLNTITHDLKNIKHKIMIINDKMSRYETMMKSLKDTIYKK